MIFRMNRKQREKKFFLAGQLLASKWQHLSKEDHFWKGLENQDVECFWRERTPGNEEYLQKGNYKKMSHYKTANIFHIEGFWTNIVLETLTHKSFSWKEDQKGKERRASLREPASASN